MHEEQSDGKKLKEQTEARTLYVNNYETLWIMLYFCWMMLELCLTWWLNLLDDVWMSTWFFGFFLIFFNFVLLIWILVKPNFDQDLNKSKTSKWRTKPGYFLVNPKWSCGEVFEIFMKNVLKWGSKGRVNGLISKQGFFDLV